ncbi:DinB family protein [Streptomyces cylindrosporus]|uniref:DinB family protein n=1 Tax=Streptomyces cylindrosporus TaxID=2927583 RepID=A0ABS9Y3M2_9ACTN|nr:DinB family protein [Streptomyces cylindrosporus]MCI3270556.1 DinB family protein [Streptomyces cylindrosporus]
MGESDFTDLRGAKFERADMTGARFTTVNLNRASLRDCALKGVRMRGVEITGTTIDGEVESLVVNGVDVAPLVEAELDRRHPDRPRFRPTTAEGFREAWALNERLWATTVERARRLPPELLHESVDGEWSFVQTLRHLAFATQAWIDRGILGDPAPWHPLSLPWDQMDPRPGVPHDREARPSLDEALALRLTAMGTVRRVVAELTDEQLDLVTEPLEGPGWPDEGASFPVRQCLLVVLNEEWWHRMYAERDLAVLEGRG